MSTPDTSTPRNRYWSTEVDTGTDTCPECGGKLQQSNQSYGLAVSAGGQPTYCTSESDGGFFCSACAAVVLDYEAFAQKAIAAVGASGKVNFSVLGVIDTNQIPEDQRGFPLDQLKGPLPLVQFSNLQRRPAADPSPSEGVKMTFGGEDRPNRSERRKAQRNAKRKRPKR